MTRQELEQMSIEGLTTYIETLVDQQEQARRDMRNLEEMQKDFARMEILLPAYMKALCGYTELKQGLAEDKLHDIGCLIATMFGIASRTFDNAEAELEIVAPIYEARLEAAV